MADYLVTGTGGFIGSKVAELLLADGHHVAGVDNLNDAYDPRLKQWRLERLAGREWFTFHRLDIGDLGELRRVFDSGVDAVLHLAARAGVRQSVKDPWAYVESNVTGTLNLLEMCREYGVSKLVLASTSSIYGEDTPSPFSEDSPANRPLSPYASSKKSAEALVYAYHHLHGLDATVVRFFTVYGPAGRPDMSIFRFVRAIAEGEPVRLFGDGGERDFTHVDDAARGAIAGLRPLGYEIINLGSDRPIAITEVISFIESILGKKAKIEYASREKADVLTTWANIDRARTLLSWRPQVAFEDGVRGAVDWYKENREWARHSR